MKFHSEVIILPTAVNNFLFHFHLPQHNQTLSSYTKKTQRNSDLYQKDII